MIGLLAGLAAPVIKGVTGIFEKRENRRTAEASAKGALAVARQQGTNEVNLQRAEWEALMAKASDKSWKDEVALILVMAPFALIIIGALWAVVPWGNILILDGVNEALTRFDAIGLDYGLLVYVVVGASFGVRIWKK